MPLFKCIIIFIDTVASAFVVHMVSRLTLYHGQLCFGDQIWLNIFR